MDRAGSIEKVRFGPRGSGWLGVRCGVCLDQVVNCSTFLKVWWKNKCGSTKHDEPEQHFCGNGSPRHYGSLPTPSWARTCDFPPESFLSPIFRGIQTTQKELLSEAALRQWQREFRAPAPWPPWRKTHLKCLLYCLPEFPIRTGLPMYAVVFCFTPNPWLLYHFFTSLLELSGIPSQVNYSNHCLGVCWWEEIPSKPCSVGIGAHGSVQWKRCLGGDTHLETNSIHKVVEAREGNELTLRKGEEGRYLGHKRKKKKLKHGVWHWIDLISTGTFSNTDLWQKSSQSCLRIQN